MSNEPLEQLRAYVERIRVYLDSERSALSQLPERRGDPRFDALSGTAAQDAASMVDGMREPVERTVQAYENAIRELHGFFPELGDLEILLGNKD